MVAENGHRIASGETAVSGDGQVEKTQPRASQVAKRANRGVARAGDAKQAPDEGTDGWCTPKWLADALGYFELDPCSNDRSHIRAGEMVQASPVDLTLRQSSPVDLDQVVSFERRTRTKQGDGLAEDWSLRSVFVNPPYSDVGPWARKLAAHDGPWVALVKLDPTTKWWATLMSVAPVVAPFRKRIRFESGTDGDMTANFPSVLVYSAWCPPRALRPHLWLPTYEIQQGAAP